MYIEIRIPKRKKRLSGFHGALAVKHIRGDKFLKKIKLGTEGYKGDGTLSRVHRYIDNEHPNNIFSYREFIINREQGIVILKLHSYAHHKAYRKALEASNKNKK